MTQTEEYVGIHILPKDAGKRLSMPLSKYEELMEKAQTFDEVFDLLREYQYQERTNPGPKYEHANRCKALVHDLEWIFRKYCGPTVEECPYAE